MSQMEAGSDPHRQQLLYWDQMYELKTAAVYIRLYRDSLGYWVTALGALKAIASCGSIAAWAIWQRLAFLWGSVIAVAQLADALKDVFPFARRHKAAASLALTLNLLFIDVQMEWENIFSGRYTDEEIRLHLHRLRKLQIEAENHHFPEGLALRSQLLEQAKKEAEQTLAVTYGLK